MQLIDGFDALLVIRQNFPHQYFHQQLEQLDTVHEVEVEN